MKIKAEHYIILRERISPYLKGFKEQDLLDSMRLRWDIYWASGTPINNSQEFNYLDDNNIDTAIKAIIREYYK